MDIGKINNNYVDNTIKSTINNTKSKVGEDDFESSLKNIVKNKDEKELRKVCQEFEGILLGMVYKQMKATVPKASLIPDAIGKDVFEGMLDDEINNQSTQNRSYGLADQLYKQLSRQFKED